MVICDIGVFSGADTAPPGPVVRIMVSHIDATDTADDSGYCYEFGLGRSWPCALDDGLEIPVEEKRPPDYVMFHEYQYPRPQPVKKPRGRSVGRWLGFPSRKKMLFKTRAKRRAYVQRILKGRRCLAEISP